MLGVQEVRRERLLQHEEAIRAIEKERARERARIRELEEAAAQLQNEVRGRRHEGWLE